jgi:hypothetical protein
MIADLTSGHIDADLTNGQTSVGLSAIIAITPLSPHGTTRLDQFLTSGQTFDQWSNLSRSHLSGTTRRLSAMIAITNTTHGFLRPHLTSGQTPWPVVKRLGRWWSNALAGGQTNRHRSPASPASV